MKLLLTIKASDIEPLANAELTSGYRTREAARAVLLDENGKVYLLKVGVHNYHKLPGGGIDPGETPLEALKRELMEEVGCEAEVATVLGKIIEYRDYDGLKQTSYCYAAKQINKQQKSALEPSELAEGMHKVKAASITEALKLLETDMPNNLEGKYIQKRDLAILRAALL